MSKANSVLFLEWCFSHYIFAQEIFTTLLHSEMNDDRQYPQLNLFQTATMKFFQLPWKHHTSKLIEGDNSNDARAGWFFADFGHFLIFTFASTLPTGAYTTQKMRQCHSGVRFSDHQHGDITENLFNLNVLFLSQLAGALSSRRLGRVIIVILLIAF